MRAHKYTPDQIEFLRQNAHGLRLSELTAAFNQHFGLQLYETQIKGIIQRQKIHSGLKGNSFSAMVGEERIGKRGMIEVRLASSPYKKSHSKWRGKHLLIWESLHGPIPEGHVVIFRDGDNRNFDPSNLILLQHRVWACLTNRGLIDGLNSNDDEILQTLKTVTDTALAVYDLQKCSKQKADIRTKRSEA